MKKRLLALMLMLCMVISFLPMTAKAEQMTIPDGIVYEVTDGEVTICYTDMQPEEAVVIPESIDVNFVGTSLSLKGDIGLNFFITLPEEIRLDENAYMKFTTGSTVKTVPLSQGMLDASDGSYRYSIPLNAKNMGDDVTAQVYVGDTPVSDTKTLSIKFYADYMIANSSNKKLVELMKSMLNYGAAAQVNFGYDTANLVNGDMSAADQMLPANLDVSKYAHSQSGSEAGIEITNASLLLQSETKIRIYFKLAEGKALNDYVFTVDGVKVTPVKSGDEYYIEKPNVAAKDLDTIYTFRLGNRQLTYCGMSYVNQVVNYSKDENLLNLVKSLYTYNQEANAYFQPDEVAPDTGCTEPEHQHDYKCEVTRPPTCSNPGEATYTCSCGHSYTEIVPKNEHVWSEWVVTIEPTTTSYGKKVRICELCHGAQEVSIDPLPGDDGGNADCENGMHTYVVNTRKEPTCEEYGSMSTICSACGELGMVDIIPPTGHSWGDWVSAGGTDTRTCSACGKTETRETPANICEEHGWSHTMSDADKAKITRGDNYYKIVCICGRACIGSNRDAALSVFNAHAAEKQWSYCGEIMRESANHYHNIPDNTIVCVVCGKMVEYGDCYRDCWGYGDGECPYD